MDGVFYSAGMEIIKPTRSLKAQDVDQTLGAALLGALGAAKCCASKRFWCQTGPQTDGGSLVFMSSVSAHAGQPGLAAYGAARAGVLGLVRNLAVELAPLNVRVNALTSGAVATQMHDRITSRLSDTGAAAYNQAHPLGIGQPQDITEISLLLLSAAGAWITGADLTVDGGFLA